MLHELNIAIHVVTGILAMIIGLIPLLSIKGGKTHRRYGRLFLYLISIVLVTAIFGVVFFRDRPFLTVITMTSFYSAYSGYRVLKTKENGAERIDFFVMIFIGLIVVAFLWNLQNANIVWEPVVIYSAVSYLIFMLVFDMLRYLVPTLIKVKRFWLYEHVWKIIGAFGALLAAGAGTVLTAYHPWSQILPSVFGILLTIFWLIKLARKQVQGIQ